MVSERPILFSGPMVRAIIQGNKTMTRRVLKFNEKYHPGETERDLHQYYASIHPDGAGTGWIAFGPTPVSAETTKKIYPGADGFKCPYGTVGDRLWVRENIRAAYGPQTGRAIEYRADCSIVPVRHGKDDDRWLRVARYKNPRLDADSFKTVPSILMPRWASRVTLEITRVRAERVNRISCDDALAEGVDAESVSRFESMMDGTGDRSGGCAERLAFRHLWDSINGHRGYGWNENPWVWAVDFKRVTS